MFISTRWSWSVGLGLAATCVACGNDGGVEASGGPAGFVAMDEPAAPSGAAATVGEPAASVAPPPAEEARPKRSSARGAANDEVALAAALVHQETEALKAWLARDGARFAEDRRALALALSHAARGSLSDAKRVADDIDDDELSAAERELLQAALAGPGKRAAPAAYGGDSPLALAMDMLVRERDARASLAAKNVEIAARAFSSLMRDELSAPWDGDPATLARWNQGLAEAQRAHRWSVRGKWPALDVKVRKGDSLTLIRKRVLAEHPEMLICTGLVARANQLKDDDAIKPDDVLRVPTDRASVLVDVSSRWMLYMLGDEVAAAFEIGVGRDGHDTPTGTFTVGPKQKNPMWFPKGAKPVPFGDPENPLGTRWIPWMRDGVKTDVGFHGTNEEAGVGGRVSQGCVRLRNVDAELVFDILPEGATIVVQD
ncbi:MAG: L,D-transpeptidase [Planctomycetes bacterium]|nr:L,D-transpeptidase [Planctomycetota bacterium]